MKDADILFNDDLWAVVDDEQLARNVLDLEAPENIDTQSLSPHSYPPFFRARVLRELLENQGKPKEEQSSLTQIATRFHIDKSTASRWLKDYHSHGKTCANPSGK